ncbi:MAG TPA: Spy/CpxP family protein refolding chaperone [Oculatellaceae cyanobacterium]
MRKAPLLVLSLGVALTLSNASYAGDDGQNTRKGLIAEKIAGDAPHPKFTDDQLEKMHAIRTKYADSGMARMIEMQKLQRQIGDGLAQTNLDKGALVAMQNKVNDLESQANSERLQMMVEMHDVLTPEQRQEMHRHMLAADAHMGVGAGPIMIHRAGGLGFGFHLPPGPGLPLGPGLPPGPPPPMCDL